MKKNKQCKDIVAKDNILIKELRHFNLSELRLLMFCLKHYDGRKKEDGTLRENQYFTAPLSELCDLFGMSRTAIYSRVKESFDIINSHSLTHVEGKTRTSFPWFHKMSFHEGEGTFTFKISKMLVPYILNLEGNYTWYYIQDVRKISLPTGLKLYENFKRWEPTGTWDVALEDLKFLLGVEGKYSRWVDFRKKVLEPALSEINKVTSLIVEYKPIKEGRSVAGLAFFIDKKVPDEVITQPDDCVELYKALLAVGLAEKTAKRYSEAAQEKELCQLCIEKIPELKERWAKKKRGSLVAYVTGALKKELNIPDTDQEPPRDKPQKKPAEKKKKSNELPQNPEKYAQWLKEQEEKNV